MASRAAATVSNGGLIQQWLPQAAQEGDAAKADKRRKRKKAEEAADDLFLEDYDDGDFQVWGVLCVCGTAACRCGTA